MSLNFAESTSHRKTNARGSFETQNLFIFFRISPIYIQGKPNLCKT